MKLTVLFILTLSINLLNAQNFNSDKGGKTYNFSYPANEISTLKIENQYGNIVYSGAPKDEVTIDVTVTIENPDDEEAPEILQKININPKLSNKTLEIVTQLSRIYYSGNKISVTYLISGPSKLALIFNNQFGDIEVDTFTGNAEMTIDNGNLSITGFFSSLKLNAKNGKINLPEINTVNANISNTNLLLKKVEIMEIEAEYATINIENAGKAIVKGFLCELFFDKVDNLSVFGAQNFVKCKSIKSEALFEIQKGSINIGRILQSTQNISATVSETPIQLGIDASMAYALHGEIKNGNFEHPKKAELRIFREGKTLSFNGLINKQGSNDNLSSIILFSENSDITIKHIVISE